ncbi:MAG: DUF2442 domain-containing protein [Candidatus Fimivivens sp.]|nr:DUF2442 domain-containing protein [Candidatus Fimivivens sp.]
MEKYFYRRVFRSVTPLPDYQLKIEMETGNAILFDFTSRLRSVRYGMLQDKEVFNSVRTDGDTLIFGINDNALVTITADDFMDLLMIDRTQ